MTEKSKKLPSPSAPAEEVREYITQLLVTRYSTPVDIAEKHARKWEIGTFSQLSNASPQSLSDIFNTNVGLCLGNALHDDMRDYLDEQPSVIGAKYALRLSVVILASVLLLALASSLGFPFAQDRASWAVSPFPWYFFSFSTGYYAYKHNLRDTSLALCLVFAYFALIIGFCASLP